MRVQPAIPNNQPCHAPFFSPHVQENIKTTYPNKPRKISPKSEKFNPKIPSIEPVLINKSPAIKTIKIPRKQAKTFKSPGPYSSFQNKSRKCSFISPNSFFIS